MSKLKEKFKKDIIAKLKKELKEDNVMAIPVMEKVTLNVGLSRANGNVEFLKDVERDLRLISGQKAAFTQAKKAIAGFKIRQGQKVGIKVTLRGGRMWDFVDKLVNISIPRIKDFRGIEKRIVDDRGNFNLGIKEQTIFPEIAIDEVSTIFGLQVNIKTSANNQEEGLKLFKLLGFPFKEDEDNAK